MNSGLGLGKGGLGIGLRSALLNSGRILILDKSNPDLKASGLENLKLAEFCTTAGTLNPGNLIWPDKSDLFKLLKNPGNSSCYLETKN